MAIEPTGMLESTTFWVGVSFVIFWALALKPAVKAVNSWLDGKIGKIERDLSAAASLRAEAEALLLEARSRHDAAASEVNDIMTRAQVEATALTVRAAADLQHSLERREKAAHERIAQLEAKVAAELQQLTATVAINAARALLTADLDDTARSKLADSAIADLSKAA